MYTAIQNKFNEALTKKALLFTPSTEIRKTWEDNVNAIYTLAPALAKKPVADQESKPEPAGNEPSSPWLPPDEQLVVDKLDDYTVVLNKFAVAKYHFLLVTNSFVKQSLPLSEDDLAASFKLLREVNKESGKRHIGFYNSGPQSGASVAHKHIQFMTLPDSFTPFPDTISDLNHEEGCTASKNIPFAHYIAGIAKDADAETLALRYSEVLGRVLTMVSRSNPETKRPEISYNLVFTEEWIMATPRSNEKAGPGISINALGTIGLVLAKSEEQLHQIEELGSKLVLEAGYPYEEVKEYRPDHTGYTHY